MRMNEAIPRVLGRKLRGRGRGIALDRAKPPTHITHILELVSLSIARAGSTGGGNKRTPGHGLRNLSKSRSEVRGGDEGGRGSIFEGFGVEPVGFCCVLSQDRKKEHGT